MSHTNTKRSKSNNVKTKKVSRKYKSEIKKDPLSLRVLQIAAQKSFDAAAKETMKVMGYNVIAREGWIGNLYPDGRFEKVSPIPQVEEKK